MLAADYPPKFGNSVTSQFHSKLNEHDDFTIQPGFIETPKQIILVEIPYCIKIKDIQNGF